MKPFLPPLVSKNTLLDYKLLLSGKSFTRQKNKAETLL